jgi:quinol monooxygenase YgiN
MLPVSTEHVQRSRKEPGCISHHVSIDADDPLTLHFTERWESVEALKTHFRVPESRAMWKRLQELAAPSRRDAALRSNGNQGLRNFLRSSSEQLPHSRVYLAMVNA